jgi:hypothetical protein
MKQLGFIIALLIFQTSLFAQSYGEIQGTVYDSNGKSTLPMAAIRVIAGENVQGVVSGLDGRFKIKPLASGTYKVEITFTGYQTQVLEGVIVRPDKITKLAEIVLAELTLDMPTAEVIYWKIPLIDPDNTGMTTIGAEQIEHTSETRNLQGFISKSFTEVSTNPEGTELYFRGSRGGTNLYIVDGVKIMGQLPSVPSSGIGSMSVYTGGVPAKYGDFTGGVVVIETKNYFDLYKEQQNEARQ